MLLQPATAAAWNCTRSETPLQELKSPPGTLGPVQPSSAASACICSTMAASCSRPVHSGPFRAHLHRAALTFNLEPRKSSKQVLRSGCPAELSTLRLPPLSPWLHRAADLSTAAHSMRTCTDRFYCFSSSLKKLCRQALVVKCTDALAWQINIVKK